MNITEWKLALTYQYEDHEKIKEIIYRGNENILFRQWIGGEMQKDMRIDRNSLEKFMELIK